MNNLILRIIASFQNEDGQALAEYGLVVALIAVVAIGVLTAMGLDIVTKVQALTDVLQ